MAKSTPAQSSIFDLLTPAPPNATSSPESAAGPSPSISLAGLEIAKSGPPPCRVSRFRSQENEKGQKTTVISGPFSIASSASDALQSSLANRLRRRMGENGSPLYALTWKRLAMPSAPHVCQLAASVRLTRRYRLFWLAHRCDEGREGRLSGRANPVRQAVDRHAGHDGALGGVADADSGQRRRLTGAQGRESDGQADGWLESDREPADDSAAGPWRDPDWLYCRDGKWRPIKSGLEPLVNGVPGRVGKLRAAGNAIVPQVAAEFIAAYLEEHPQ